MKVDIAKGGGRAPPFLPGWANFSIMMEWTPESGPCHFVCTLWVELMDLACQHGIGLTVVGLQLIVGKAYVLVGEKNKLKLSRDRQPSRVGFIDF